MLLRGEEVFFDRAAAGLILADRLLGGSNSFPIGSKFGVERGDASRRIRDPATRVGGAGLDLLQVDQLFELG
jgi:hypothetical protein